jgi:glycerol-3-phosphate cytidylyltransferase-like family protein
LSTTTQCTGQLVRSFDLINVLDLDLVAQARQLCTRLVIGVHSDELVTQLTGRSPVMPLSERLLLAAHVRGVDEIFVCEAGATLLDPDTVTLVIDEAVTQVRLDTTRFTESPVLQRALEPASAAVAS